MHLWGGGFCSHLASGLFFLLSFFSSCHRNYAMWALDLFIFLRWWNRWWMKEKEWERKKKNWGVGSGGFFHSFFHSDSSQFPHISTTRSLWRSSGGTQAQAQAQAQVQVQVQAQGCMRPSSKKEENSIASSILTGFSVHFHFLYFYSYFYFFARLGSLDQA